MTCGSRVTRGSKANRYAHFNQPTRGSAGACKFSVHCSHHLFYVLWLSKTHQSFHEFQTTIIEIDDHTLQTWNVNEMWSSVNTHGFASKLNEVKMIESWQNSLPARPLKMNLFCRFISMSVNVWCFNELWVVVDLKLLCCSCWINET